MAADANIGDATRSPTIKADDTTPSSKLLRLKVPLHEIGIAAFAKPYT